MDDRRFDHFVRSLAARGSRRTLIKGLLGFSGIVAVAGSALNDEVRAARRPTPTPKPVRCPGNQIWNGSACACESGTECGSDCCPVEAMCCDNACCFGECYGEGVCCPTGRLVCDGSCLPPGGCCTDDDCTEARCFDNVCVPNTPTNTPTNTPEPPTATPTSTPTGDCENAVLAGGDGPTSIFHVDDDVEVFVNGESVFVDNNHNATDISPIALGPLSGGDTVRVVASDTSTPQYCPGSFELGPVTLYCTATGTSQVINPIVLKGYATVCGEVFFDETITVAL